MKKFFVFALFLISLGAQSQVVANFSASPIAGCKPLSVSFTDLSSGGVTSWIWNFGNGNSGIGQHPSAIYVLPGVYTVTLTVSDGVTTNTKIKTNYIVVYNKPQANFTTN